LQNLNNVGRMNPISTDWSYLEIEGDHVLLRRKSSVGKLHLTDEGGDYCGEWGAIIDEHSRPIGIRVFFFFDYLSNHPFAKANNCSRHADELHVYFKDDRLPDIDQMPFLPVIRNPRPEGGDILHLSGYDY
jgi:hypothetical protein